MYPFDGFCFRLRSIFLGTPHIHIVQMEMDEETGEKERKSEKRDGFVEITTNVVMPSLKQ